MYRCVTTTRTTVVFPCLFLLVVNNVSVFKWRPRGNSIRVLCALEARRKSRWESLLSLKRPEEILEPMRGAASLSLHVVMLYLCCLYQGGPRPFIYSAVSVSKMGGVVVTLCKLRSRVM
jgi:hypothetical protein